MTEAEWIACANPDAMLLHVRCNATQSKLRLFATTCCGQVWHLLDPKHHASRELTARLTDCDAAFVAVGAAHSILLDPSHSTHPTDESHAVAFANYQVTHEAAFDAVRAAAESARRALPPGDAAAAAQASLLRELFGNPFREVKVDRGWRTDTVLSLAGQVYESCDFSLMPILADALQDAGCDNADVLDHCRSDGSHVRGCWVVDLVLGKE
jgi:hypothetical protein